MPSIILSTRIDKQIQKDVKEHCKKRNQKIQGFIENALIDRLGKENFEKGKEK